LLVATDGSSISQGHAAIVFTLLLLFLMTVIFMTSLLGTPRVPPQPNAWFEDYRRLSTTTSTSHGRSVPFFFGSCVFLPFMTASLCGRFAVCSSRFYRLPSPAYS
jgi:hypothetical protein